MKYKPHNYQQHAINYITTHNQAAILLGMGMGKTIITLTAINNLIYNTYQVNQALIIAPLRVARDTWPAEIKKWDHLQHLTTALCIGDKKTREQAINTTTDITIINRENIPWLVKQHGKNWPYDMVIIDELSSFKSPQSQRFKALKQIRPHINRIVGLTGTPAPNSLEDLWAPFRLIDEGKRLGKYITHYHNQYFTPDKRNAQRIFTWKLKPQAEQAIYNQIKDITISMKTTDHLELPPLTETTHTTHLTPQQKKTYTTLKNNMIAHINNHTIDAGSAAVLSGKLLQLASGAIYTEEKNTIEIHQQKLDALEDIIEAANGQTILIAYWFKHELERLKERFPQARELATSQDITDWCEQKIPIGLIHPASAGHGLNLQSGGHIMVWLTTPWSLELVEQTNARLFRQGQTEPVSIIHITTEGTIDTEVLKALKRKDTTQTALINAVKAQIGDQR